MDGVSVSNNLALYMMLIICVVLVTVDSIEIYRLIKTWGIIDRIDPVVFTSCFQNEFLIKTTFSIFSFLAAVSALSLIFFLIISVELFFDKLLFTYIYTNYFIFGPCMLGFSILGLIYWNDVVYVCDKRFMMNKEFSIGNMFCLLGCFLLSLTISIGFSVYNTIGLYVDSILRREDGNKYIRQLFWWAVFRGRSSERMHPVVPNE